MPVAQARIAGTTWLGNSDGAVPNLERHSCGAALLSSGTMLALGSRASIGRSPHPSGISRCGCAAQGRTIPRAKSCGSLHDQQELVSAAVASRRQAACLLAALLAWRPDPASASALPAVFDRAWQVSSLLGGSDAQGASFTCTIAACIPAGSLPRSHVVVHACSELHRLTRHACAIVIPAPAHPDSQ